MDFGFYFHLVQQYKGNNEDLEEARSFVDKFRIH